jgi:hypothetical protein
VIYWLLRKRPDSAMYELVPMAWDASKRWRPMAARILLASTFGAERMLPAGSVLLRRNRFLGDPEFRELWGPAEMKQTEVA